MSQSASLPLLWTEAFALELQTFFANRLKCPEAAADLTHETYLRLHQSMTRAPADNARALAFRIAVNLAIDYQRRLNVRNQHLADSDSDTYADTVADPAGNEPSKILISRERYAALQAALAELPADCRTAFLLNRVEDLSYLEIAQRMGISRSKVGRLLEQALAHCTRKLEP
ncbi:RNA polymerase sigma factor [Methylomonas sp. MED-D]|uniref:RNA polymerase sigma factor n=1 Tax=unclassified Methylomonas TaxID=2608980 RepID=UPI00143A53F7|nr:RNA polymerase sigma factor [Methylomonas sp. MV1]MDT4331454.1 RNA polymerase sigma factor [Methylomonas sp. MV1]NJA05349.1 RNA polymerase sigma factor [Methylococcaceae bacterium WWC4]